MEADFSGWATKANLKCTDGRTIRPDAFKDQDKMTVPLVWQHGHNSPENVLGHAVLHNRPEGVWTEGFFNNTQAAQAARILVEHGDVKALSIFANQLIEKSKQVLHGVIREVSICLAGANPGAFITNVTIRHSDGELEDLADEAIISPWEALVVHSASTEEVDEEELELAHATLQEVYDSLNEEQVKLVQYMVGTAVEQATNGSAKHSDTDGEDPAGDTTEDENLEHQEGNNGMTRNVFETYGQGGGQGGASGELKHDMITISRDDVRSIVHDAIHQTGSLKKSLYAYAEKNLEHGINDIELLFPEAKTLENTPQWNKRRTEWVAGVLGGTSKSPFAKVKSIVADITQDDARALGYITGNYKKEEWFDLSARSTGPTTVYKKQKLDRDNIIDITDFDVVVWMKGEMRLMLEEEIARAILIGDGRDPEDPDNAGQPNPDKIKDPAAASSGDGIRSILNENELYATTTTVSIGTGANAYQDAIDQVQLDMEFYKGTGSPTFYGTRRNITRMLQTKDGMGRRLYRNRAELADELGVGEIVEVEVMDQVPDVLGIIVNLADYNVGTDKGGEVNFFDDFDIDYNQYKYLGETRLSGALVKIKSALIVKIAGEGDTAVTPAAPTFDEETGVVTIVATTGVVYKNKDTGATLTAGAQTALAPGATLNVHAEPDATHYIPNSTMDDWSFTRPAA
jgi:hypothetical protein